MSAALVGTIRQRLEAIETLLSEELSFRETRHLKTALGTFRLMPLKILNR